MSSLKRVAIIGSGAGTTADAVAFAGQRSGVIVSLVIGNNSRAGIFDIARRRGINALHLSTVTHPDADARDTAMLNALADARVDLIILAGYMKKIGPLVLEHYRGRIINTHPSLLPAYGSTGMYGDRVHEAVLHDGATVTGATIHLVTENYDEGPILAQIPVDVLLDDDVSSLRDRVQTAEKSLLLDWLATWSSGVEQTAR